MDLMKLKQKYYYRYISILLVFKVGHSFISELAIDFLHLPPSTQFDYGSPGAQTSFNALDILVIG
jgi:hypothetical protein